MGRADKRHGVNASKPSEAALMLSLRAGPKHSVTPSPASIPQNRAWHLKAGVGGQPTLGRHPTKDDV
jgi:hypothetical protein